jgi:hypothetical protein
MTEQQYTQFQKKYVSVIEMMNIYGLLDTTWEDIKDLEIWR